MIDITKILSYCTAEVFMLCITLLHVVDSDATTSVIYYVDYLYSPFPLIFTSPTITSFLPSFLPISVPFLYVMVKQLNIQTRTWFSAHCIWQYNVLVCVWKHAFHHLTCQFPCNSMTSRDLWLFIVGGSLKFIWGPIMQFFLISNTFTF